MRKVIVRQRENEDGQLYWDFEVIGDPGDDSKLPFVIDKGCGTERPDVVCIDEDGNESSPVPRFTGKDGRTIEYTCPNVRINREGQSVEVSIRLVDAGED